MVGSSEAITLVFTRAALNRLIEPMLDWLIARGVLDDRLERSTNSSVSSSGT